MSADKNGRLGAKSPQIENGVNNILRQAAKQKAKASSLVEPGEQGEGGRQEEA